MGRLGLVERDREAAAVGRERDARRGLPAASSAVGFGLVVRSHLGQRDDAAAARACRRPGRRLARSWSAACDRRRSREGGDATPSSTRARRHSRARAPVLSGSRHGGDASRRLQAEFTAVTRLDVGEVEQPEGEPTAGEAGARSSSSVGSVRQSASCRSEQLGDARRAARRCPSRSAQALSARASTPKLCGLPRPEHRRSPSRCTGGCARRRAAERALVGAARPRRLGQRLAVGEAARVARRAGRAAARSS